MQKQVSRVNAERSRHVGDLVQRKFRSAVLEHRDDVRVRVAALGGYDPLAQAAQSDLLSHESSDGHGLHWSDSLGRCPLVR